MDIQEMHQYFRVYGQQVGMQNIRAILPEEIDAFLNVAINEKVREVLVTNAISNENKVLTGNNTIGNLNFFRTLYDIYRVTDITNSVENNQNISVADIDFTNIMYITNCIVQYEYTELHYNCRIIDINELENTIHDYCNSPSFDYPICRITDNIIIYTGSKIPKNITLNYIKNPNIVSLDDNVSCDLPEYIHYEIVQLAVQTYFNSVGATTQKVE